MNGKFVVLFLVGVLLTGCEATERENWNRIQDRQNELAIANTQAQARVDAARIAADADTAVAEAKAAAEKARAEAAADRDIMLAFFQAQMDQSRLNHDENMFRYWSTWMAALLANDLSIDDIQALTDTIPVVETTAPMEQARRSGLQWWEILIGVVGVSVGMGLILVVVWFVARDVLRYLRYGGE